jgi:hypothetical protein
MICINNERSNKFEMEFKLVSSIRHHKSFIFLILSHFNENENVFNLRYILQYMEL